jgi:CRP-like cAMP-binding protein
MSVILIIPSSIQGGVFKMDERSQRTLKGLSLFSALNPSDQAHLGSLLRPRSFASNETIFLQQEQGNCLYLIRTGRVKICAVDPEGVELIFTFLSVGDILGELTILDGKPRSATAIAVADTQTAYIERREFLDFLRGSPEAGISILTVLCRRLRETDRRLEDITFLDVSRRLARALLDISFSSRQSDSQHGLQITCVVTQEELASTVGASRVMVNKILNSFVDLGFIVLGRKKFSIVNSHELSRIARYEPR